MNVVLGQAVIASMVILDAAWHGERNITIMSMAKLTVIIVFTNLFRCITASFFILSIA
jgi:intracellular septation protein A